MKRAAFVGLCLSLAVTMVSAQEAARSTAHQNNAQQSSKDFVMVLPAPTCPVSMHALQGRGSGLVAVRDEKPIEGPSQRVHLILSNPRSAVVAGAKVKVFGLSGKNRLERTSDRSLQPIFARQTEDLFTFAPATTADLGLLRMRWTLCEGPSMGFSSRTATDAAASPLQCVCSRGRWAQAEPSRYFRGLLCAVLMRGGSRCFLRTYHCYGERKA